MTEPSSRIWNQRLTSVCNDIEQPLGNEICVEENNTRQQVICGTDPIAIGTIAPVKTLIWDNWKAMRFKRCPFGSSEKSMRKRRLNANEVRTTHTVGDF